MTSQGPKFPGHKHRGHHKRNKVRNGPCQQHAEDAEAEREQKNQRDQEEDLPCQREQEALECFTDGGKEIGGEQLHTVEKHHKEERAHKQNRKFKVKRLTVSEEGNDGGGEKLEQAKSHRRNGEIPLDGQ